MTLTELRQLFAEHRLPESTELLTCGGVVQAVFKRGNAVTLDYEARDDFHGDDENLLEEQTEGDALYR